MELFFCLLPNCLFDNDKRGGVKKMEQFIHDFMEIEGVPVQHTSKACMRYLQDVLGYSFNVARGVLGLAVARGYIVVSAYTPMKIYN